ncbi:MAG: iron ABC transporter permease, partial [Muribaculaceae bacterium]|nr:iron ABC transporter permease [Muribaculaceae bacterium]
AGPYVLGISSGAGLGVALFLLGAPLMGASAWTLGFGIAGAAWIGSAAVLLLMGAAAVRLKDILALLVLGMMLSSGVSAVVQILQYLSKDDALKAYVIWTMGSLGEVTSDQLRILVPAVAAGLLLAVATVKPLNLLLFGEEYARTMGLDLRKARALIFASTTLLAGTVTAYCGPIGFIGLAMPHVARMLFGSADHRVLIPATTLTGAAVLLICDIISKAFVLPINAITALLGIPVVVWIVLRRS